MRAGNQPPVVPKQRRVSQALVGCAEGFQTHPGILPGCRGASPALLPPGRKDVVFKACPMECLPLHPLRGNICHTRGRKGAGSPQSCRAAELQLPRDVQGDSM